MAHKTKVLTEYQAAVALLKKRLKLAGISYRDLARKIGLSESGLKKAFSARDGSFQRLVEICTLLGFTMVDLLAGETEPTLEITFTGPQEACLSQNPEAFALYWRLVYERRSIEEANRLGALSETRSFKLLRQLDRVKLLKLLPGGNVRVPPVQPVTWTGQGSYMKRIYQDFGLRLIRATSVSERDGRSQYIIRYFQLLPKTLGEFLEAQRALEREFLRRSIREMRMHTGELVHVRWVSASDDQSFLT
jgi:transcriptional regulator with XRE-family HTH domain